MSKPEQKRTPAPIIVRPTSRFVRLIDYLGMILLIGAFMLKNNDAIQGNWIFIFPALVFLVSIVQHTRLKLSKMTVADGKLRYETGLMSKQTRTLELAKVQDVQVRQTLTQRLFGVGDIGVETAGETGALHMRNVDRPQELADLILEASSTRK